MSTVKPHTRRTKNGNVKVRKHSRKGLQPKRAGRNAKRAFKAAKRKQHARAIALTSVAAVEIGGWFALRGTGVVLATIGVLAIGGAVLAKKVAA